MATKVQRHKEKPLGKFYFISGGNVGHKLHNNNDKEPKLFPILRSKKVASAGRKPTDNLYRLRYVGCQVSVSNISFP